MDTRMKKGARVTPAPFDETTCSDDGNTNCERKPDLSYDREIARRKPLEDFRRCGLRLLPLRVHTAKADDLGKHYFLRAANGIEIFDSQDKFSVELARHVLVRVITGKSAA